MAALFFAGMSVFFISGCWRKEQKEMERMEKEAQTYYRIKYKSNARVEKAEMNGRDTGLFGWVPNKDYSYFMSDGSVVTYLCSRDLMIDDRQYDEIQNAILDQIWKPAVQEITQTNGVEILQEGELQIGQYEDGAKGFSNLYEGDLQEFLQKEDTNLKAYDMFLVSSDSNLDEKTVEQLLHSAKTFCQKMADAFPKSCTIHMTGSTIDADFNSGFLSMDEPGYLWEVRADEYGVRSKIPVYIQAAQGIEIASDWWDLEYLPSDILLKEVSLREVQDQIDQNYKAHLEQAADVKNAAVPDKDVLISGKAYQVQLSERLKDSEDQRRSCIRVSQDLLSENEALYYFPFGSVKKYSVGFSLCTPNSRTGTHTFKEGDVLFAGKTERTRTEEHKQEDQTSDRNVDVH